MKDPEFMKLMGDYMKDISDPQHRKEQEEYISKLESEQGAPEGKILIHPFAGFVIKIKKVHLP